jgi:predicted ATPase
MSYKPSTESSSPSKFFFVIAGSTGSGKSTLLDALKKRGYRCFEEVARLIIKEEMAKDGDALPWANVSSFKRKILRKSIESYKRALQSPNQITFFDRDVLDLVAYDRLTNTQSSEELLKAVDDLLYNNHVFMLPPWQEIYRTDLERRQTFEEAKQGYNNLVKVYQEYGRKLIEVPKVPVKERADFILEKISAVRDLPR